jgi:hypothetical protein
MAWLRAHVKPDELVVSTGDDLLYDVSALRITDLPNQPELAWQTMRVWAPEELLVILRAHGARWALDARHWNGRVWTSVSAILRRLVDHHPEAIAFLGKTSAVIDLDRLEAEALKATVAVDPLGRFFGPAPAGAEKDDPLNHFN